MPVADRPGAGGANRLPWPVDRSDPAFTDGMAAALLSFFAPGAGHLYAGQRARGLLLLAGVVPLVVGVLALLLLDRTAVLGLLVQPRFLAALLLADILVLAWRVFAVVDAFRWALGTVGGSDPQRWLAGAPALAVLVVALAAPHVALAALDLQVQATISEVFDGQAAAVRSGAPADDARALATADSPPSADRVTLLLVGLDAGPMRSGRRPDTIIAVTVDLRRERAAMFAIPRNLMTFPLAVNAADRGVLRVYQDPINTLLAHGQAHAALFGGEDPGLEALRRGAEGVLGIPVDHVVTADLAGFVAVVDALGGVEVVASTPVRDWLDSPAAPGGWDGIDLHPGRHHLDGRQALLYVRSRRDADDYTRMARQRCVLSALAQQADTAALLTGLPRLLSALRDSVETDVPADLLPRLVRRLPAVRAAGIEAVALVPPRFSLGRDERGYPVADIAAIRAAVRGVLDPAATAPQRAGQSPAGDRGAAPASPAPRPGAAAPSRPTAAGTAAPTSLPAVPPADPRVPTCP